MLKDCAALPTPWRPGGRVAVMGSAEAGRRLSPWHTTCTRREGAQRTMRTGMRRVERRVTMGYGVEGGRPLRAHPPALPLPLSLALPVPPALPLALALALLSHLERACAVRRVVPHRQLVRRLARQVRHALR
jgi:hypothetical protein